MQNQRLTEANLQTFVERDSRRLAMIRSNPANSSEDAPGIIAECFARH